MDYSEIVKNIMVDYSAMKKAATCFWSPSNFSIPDGEKEICLMEKKTGILGMKTDVALVFTEKGLYGIGKKVMYPDFGKYLISSCGDFTNNSEKLAFLPTISAIFGTEMTKQFKDMVNRLIEEFCKNSPEIARDRETLIKSHYDRLYKKVHAIGVDEKDLNFDDYYLLHSAVKDFDGIWAAKIMAFVMLKINGSIHAASTNEELGLIKDAISMQKNDNPLTEEDIIEFAITNIAFPPRRYKSDWIYQYADVISFSCDSKWDQARDNRNKIIAAMRENLIGNEFRKKLLDCGVSQKKLWNMQKNQMCVADAKMLEAFNCKYIGSLNSNDRDSIGLDVVHYGFLLGIPGSALDILKKNEELFGGESKDEELTAVYDHYFLARFLGLEDVAKEIIDRTPENRRLYKEVCALKAKKVLIVGKLQVGEHATNFSDGVYDAAKKYSKNLNEEQLEKLNSYHDEISSSVLTC